jgi:hypothetical protein
MPEPTPQDPVEELGDDEIDVTPTRALFVEMLTRDLLLNRAVIDLVDNSVDGAKRLRPEAGSDLQGLEVAVSLSADGFEIVDNCGGIGIDLARRYAFRFGRARGMPKTPGSVGQFGVGMKRALFKFGHKFEVVSTTVSDHFELRVDVDTWEDESGLWRFGFDIMEAGMENSLDKTGTKIKVSQLRGDAKAQFSNQAFLTSLSREIQSAQQQYIDRGLRIVVNGRSLIATPWKIIQGAGIEPHVFEDVIQLEGGTIQRRIYAGLGDSLSQAAGWYVFCNGRMILEADQSRTTGWERGDGPEDVMIPKFHGQFARFRGYVFLDSENAALLPWNTTKTGVDADTDVWRNTYTKMRSIMRPVIDALNRLDREKEAAENARPIEIALKSSSAKPLRMISRIGAFLVPNAPPGPRPPPWTSIQFSRLKSKVDALKKVYGATSNAHLGELLFDAAYSEHVGE